MMKVIKIDGMKIEQVDYEYGLKFAHDSEPLICEDSDDAQSALQLAREYDADPALMRRIIFVSGWHRADDENVRAVAS